MRTHISIRSRLALVLAGGAAALALSAGPASATVCPAGTNPLSDYCVNNTTYNFAGIVTADNPEAWYRLSDGLGATVMADSSGNFHDGEYKNGQDSGPVGISADGNFARDFWGQSGYGYVNGIEAPNQHGSSPYSSYTMEAWFYLEDTDGDLDIHNDGTIMQFGGAGAVYIKSNTLRFRNGPDDEILAPTTFKDEKWYQVTARKQGTHLRLYLNASPTSPTPFDYTPVATGSSFYLPEGSPTFYVGYGTWAPWFRGAIDEVQYYRYALTDDQIAYHFYADPAPEGDIRRPSAPSTPSTSGHSSDSSNPGVVVPTKNPTVSKARAAKLKKAKADVKRLTGLVKKTKRWVGSLKHHFAPLKAIKIAEKKLAGLQKQLKRAKAKVKSLS